MTTFQLVLLGLAITLDPLPLGAYILILGSKNGIRKGAGFTVGWILCLAVVIAATLLLTGGRPPKPNTAPSTALLIVQIVAGAALLVLAWRQRRRVRTPKPKPKWQSNLDRPNLFAAAGIAALLQPWVSIGAGAATIAQANTSHASDLAGIVAFGVLATSSYLVMQTLAMLRPAATMTRLQALNDWLDSHRDSALIVLYTVVGLWLIGKASVTLF